MTTEFLHGVETVDVTQGARPVQEVRSAVIAIIGTAPQGPVNELTLCLSATDDARFGADTTGFTIPAALKAMRDCGAGTLFVVNVCPNAVAPDTVPDPSVVALADLIGAVDIHGQRSGLQLLVEGYGRFGFDARIIIVPGYSSAPAIAAAMEVIATQLKAVTYFDLPVGLTPAEAVEARSGTVVGLSIHQTASDRIRPCYPHVQRFNPVTNQNQLEPLSVRAAGLRAATDRKIGWWTSSSNKALAGVLGLERIITCRLDDPNSEANLLNAAGITTVFRDFGTGFRLWGNRNASFPTSTAPENFEQVRRSRDMIEAAIHQNSLQWIDEDIDQAAIDSIVETNDQYMRTLTGRGSIMGGKCWFDPSRTSGVELAAGQLKIQYKFTPKYPTERLTYESEVTGEYLLNLKSTNSGDNA